MTVIVILALVALFVGLRLYSVLGERTGHEQQQPIPKPAEPDTRVDAARRRSPAPGGVPDVDSGDMAFIPTAGPGRSRLACRRSQLRRRALPRRRQGAPTG